MENKQKITKTSELDEMVRVLLSVLDARSQDIVTRRYGLKSGKVETLDSIGKEYGITRERVRQIEAQAKKLLAKRKEVLEGIADQIETYFKKHSGILTEDYLMNVIERDFNETPHSTVIVFFLDILPKYQKVTKSDKFGPHWSHPELHHKHVEQVVDAAEEILKKSRGPIVEENIVTDIRTALDISRDELPDACVVALLEASKKLKKTVFKEWGMRDWVETSPRGVGDKAYVVLRRNADPLHFREITNQINEVKFDHKSAHEQTVHNELIKDDRFVLVGRGLYGLSDWGYIPGTVADVLESILREAGRPLTRDELIEQVLKQRVFKKTTVLLALQNSNRFQKEMGSKYGIRQEV